MSGDPKVQIAVIWRRWGFADFPNSGVDFVAAGELPDFVDICGPNSSAGQDLDSAFGLLPQSPQDGSSGQGGLAASAGQYGLEAEVDELCECEREVACDIEGAVEDEEIGRAHV